MLYFRIGGTQAWVGLTRDSDNCGKTDLKCRREGWKWSDGTTYDSNVYNEWNERANNGGEPNTGDELCMRMNNGEWWGRLCSIQFACLCEKPSEY